MQKVGKRLMWYVITVLISLFCLLIGVQLLLAFSELKFSFTSTDLWRVMADTARHPLQTGYALVTARNPLFILGSLGVLVYGIYVQVRFYKGKKEGWEVDEDNPYHGSARWARPKEIFDGQNFVARSQQDILAAFTESVTQREEG